MAKQTTHLVVASCTSKKNKPKPQPNQKQNPPLEAKEVVWIAKPAHNNKERPKQTT
jgi:hypothetical protein